LLTKGDELPVFAFTVRDGIDNFSVFDVSTACASVAGSFPRIPFRRT
jgi:hypothetical protein